VSLHLAIAGKGGAGKSTVAGTLARVLARRGRQVLTLDSDLMPGLSLSLGLGADHSAMLSDAVEKDEDGRWRLRKGIGPVRAVARHAAVAPDGVRHLQLGKLDADGRGPIMGSTNGFYQVIHRLDRAPAFRSWAIVGDLPAGPRQVAFQWAPYADTLLLMVEPSWKSALTARRVAAIVRSRPGVAVLPVANKITERQDTRRVEELLGERVVAAIPADESVSRAERAGVAPIDHEPSSPAIQAIEELATRLERHAAPHRRAA
jgi:CO dehydrogenase maturation factor